MTSKGGTTAAALSVLMADAGLAQLMTKAVDAVERSIELGAQYRLSSMVWHEWCGHWVYKRTAMI